jgi:hypothetical protein
MSVGDWFSLNPLNLKNYQSEIAGLTTSVNNLQVRVDEIGYDLVNLQNEITTNSTTIQNLSDQINQINTNITSLTNTVNQLSGTISGINNSINIIVTLYQPIANFSVGNPYFIDGGGNVATGSFHGAWYRPIILQPSDISNDGVDLKFILMVIREININNLKLNGNYFFSDPLPLPIPFVNNNNYDVFWSSVGHGQLMTTRQADYVLEHTPGNFWTIAVRPITSTTISNDSACFILMYI